HVARSSLVAAGGERHALEVQRLEVPCRRPSLAAMLPDGDVAEVGVVAARLALLRLELLAEVPAARFAPLQRVEADELREVDEVRDAAGMLQRLIEVLVRAGDGDAGPELLAQPRNPLERGAQPGVVASHAAVLP